MYEHLVPEAAALVKASDAARVAWIQSNHWQPTETSKLVFEWMLYLLRSERSPDPLCMQIIASGGGGKSAMVMRFAEMHPPETVANEPSRLRRPVLLADCLNAPKGPRGLAYAILRSAWPQAPATDRFYNENWALETLRKQGVRLLILDEAAEVMVGGALNHKQSINFVKRVITQLQVNVVTATVHGLDSAFAKDPQMSSRFERKFEIPEWQEGDVFRSFLYGYERFLPFPKPSDLYGQEKMRLLAIGSKGNMRSLVRLICLSALWAVSKRADHISAAHIELARDIDSPPPPVAIRRPLEA